MIYFYGRVSSDHQENSAANQRQLGEQYGAQVGEQVTVVIDEDISGSTQLKHRPNGKVMWDALKPGDTLVVPRLDRGWRSVEDAASSLRVLREIGVRLKILDSPIDVSTDEGELMFLTFANFAQYENRVRSRRLKDVFGYRKKKGMPYGVARPFGWQRDGDQWVELPAERRIADKAAELRESGLNWSQIARKMCFSDKYRKPIHQAGQGKGRRYSQWYGSDDLKNLVLAREAGYPIVSQSELRAGALAERSA